MGRNINYSNANTVNATGGSDDYFGTGEIQTFDVTGSFTVPVGITKLRVSVLGAGAAGVSWNGMGLIFQMSTSGGASSFGSMLSASGGSVSGTGGVPFGGPGFEGGAGGGCEIEYNSAGTVISSSGGGGGGSGGGGFGGGSKNAGIKGTNGNGYGGIGGQGGRGAIFIGTLDDLTVASELLNAEHGGRGAGGGGGAWTSEFNGIPPRKFLPKNGGGGGGFIKRILNVTPGQVIPVTVGIGGSIGSHPSAGAGGNGLVIVEF
jgi:hypothetical protein